MRGHPGDAIKRERGIPVRAAHAPPPAADGIRGRPVFFILGTEGAQLSVAP